MLLTGAEAIRDVLLFPTMKSQGSAKNEANNVAQTAAAAPAETAKVEMCIRDSGMGTTYLDPTGSQIGKKESIKDTARVLAGMYEGIEYRGFGQEIVEELAKYSKVPVWNGLTNEYHPTQMLSLIHI